LNVYAIPSFAIILIINDKSSQGQIRLDQPSSALKTAIKNNILHSLLSPPQNQEFRIDQHRSPIG